MEDTARHIPVLLHESINALMLTEGDVIVDATGGGGGHSRAILSSLGSKGALVVFDQDPHVCARLKEGFKDDARVTVISQNFRHLTRELETRGIRTVDGVLMDLGWNTLQFQSGGKGFSFLSDEPLLMTFGDPKEYPFTAYDIVNSWSEETIADVLFGYAEERYSRKIARAIVQAREIKPIATTGALADIVKSATPRAYTRGRLHPATKTFQALRIAVNDELDVLRDGIESALTLLAPHRRLVIISFHSIEDRIVKRAFLEAVQKGRGHIVTKKPLVPTHEEVAQNPRARSAKLRIFQKES